MRKLMAVTLACLGMYAVTAAADVYRWTDDKGVVHYSDKPQAPSDKPVELPHLQTYQHNANPPGFAPLPTTPAAAVAPKNAGLAITSPSPGETIRDPEGKFTVEVSPGPQDGEGLVFYLDGAAENSAPTMSTAFLYARVERGEHTVAAALVGADGKELQRTPPLTVYLMPPTVKKH